MVSLPFFLGRYYDFNNTAVPDGLLKRNVLKYLFNGSSLEEEFSRYIDEFFNFLKGFLSRIFDLEKSKALEKINDFFSLSNETSFKSLSSQISYLYSLSSVSLPVDDASSEEKNKREQLKELTIEVKNAISNLKELIEESSNLQESLTKLNTKLESLEEELKKLVKFIGGEESNINSAIDNIRKSISNELENKHGKLTKEQKNLLTEINNLKEAFKKDFKFNNFYSGWTIDTLQKNKIITYFSLHPDKLGEKIDLIKEQFYKKVGSTPRLFIDYLYNPNYGNKNTFKRLILTFFKYVSRLNPVEDIYANLFSRLRNQKSLLKKFSYENIYSFLEPVGLILTMLDVAYEVGNPELFFNTTDYKESLYADLLTVLKGYSVKSSSKLKESLSFLKDNMTKAQYYSDCKNIFKQRFPSPKYFLGLAKKYFEHGKFEKMVKSFVKYFYISNRLFIDPSLRLFDFEEQIKLKPSTDQQTDSSEKSQQSVISLTPGAIPPAPPAPAESSVRAPFIVEDLSKEKLKSLILEPLLRKYKIEDDKDKLIKLFVNEFYVTLINFFQLVVERDFKSLIDKFESLQKGRFINNIFDPRIRSQNYNIRNQQIKTFDLIRDISDINSLVNALVNLKPSMKCSKDNVLSISFQSDYDFKTSSDAIIESLKIKLLEKYTPEKGFYIEEYIKEQGKYVSRKLTKDVEIQDAIDSNIINFIEEKIFNKYLKILLQYKDMKIDFKKWKDWNLIKKRVFERQEESQQAISNQESHIVATIRRDECQLNEIGDKITSLKEELAKETGSFQNSVRKLNSLKIELRALKTRRGDLKYKITEFENQMGQLETKIEEIKKRREVKAREIDDIFIKNKNSLEKLIKFYIAVLEVINEVFKDPSDSSEQKIKEFLRDRNILSFSAGITVNDLLNDITEYIPQSNTDLIEAKNKLKKGIIDKGFVFADYFNVTFDCEYRKLCSTALVGKNWDNIKRFLLNSSNITNDLLYKFYDEGLKSLEPEKNSKITFKNLLIALLVFLASS